MGEFTSALAHEINQPLLAILNNSQSALRFLAFEQPDLNEARDALRDIIADDQRAGDTIRNLRSFLQRKEATRVIVDLNTVIEDVLSILVYEIAYRNVSVTRELAPGLPSVECDRVALQQVFINLLLNACDSVAAETPERRIGIRTSIGGPAGVLVSVRTRGGD